MKLHRAAFAAFLLIHTAARSAVWMTPVQAAERCFPDAKAKAEAVEEALDGAQAKALRALLKPHGTRGRAWTWPKAFRALRCGADWLVLVEEVGKHRPILFAVGVDARGRVGCVEVLEYRENYGSEIRREGFLKQFRGRRWKDPIARGEDLDAVSGATYSSDAAARAVRKALALLKVTGRLP